MATIAVSRSQTGAHACKKEAFASRCEIYLADPRAEKRKTRWVVELAFLIRDRHQTSIR